MTSFSFTAIRLDLIPSSLNLSKDFHHDFLYQTTKFPAILVIQEISKTYLIRKGYNFRDVKNFEDEGLSGNKTSFGKITRD